MLRPALLVLACALAAPGLARAQDDVAPVSPHSAAWKAKAQKVTEAGMKDIVDCQKQALKKHPKLEGGQAKVHWLVDDQGNVSAVHVTGAAARDTDLKRCIEQAVSGWTFPPWTAGANEAPYVPLSQTVTLKMAHPEEKAKGAKRQGGS